jgi:TrpR family trp operon transcriptional repressor
MGGHRSNALNEIAEALCGITDPSMMRRFLESILTPRELEEIRGRWQVVTLLSRGISQRRIAKKLGLSLCKITRGSRELRKRNSAFQRVLENYRARRRIPEGERQ